MAAAVERFPDWAAATDLRAPVGEALVNALRHAGGGSYQVFARGDALQVLVRDEGPGIDFRMLPRATLRGFSTASSLGMGFTIMLQGARGCCSARGRDAPRWSWSSPERR